MVVTSDEFAGIFIPPSVRDEIADKVACDWSGAVLQDGHVRFVYEVAEGVLVLCNNQRDTRYIGLSDDGEIEGGCHRHTEKEQVKQKPPKGAEISLPKGRRSPAASRSHRGHRDTEDRQGNRVQRVPSR